MTSVQRRTRWAALAAVVTLWSVPARAQGVVVKMATLVPDGSAWHGIMKEMAEEWKTVSGGGVTLRIYAGGVARAAPVEGRNIRLRTHHPGMK